MHWRWLIFPCNYPYNDYVCVNFFVGVNQKCKYDEHCIEGAFCENQKTCKCKDDFVASLDGSACYSKFGTFNYYN